jgi:hypothetical protein
MGTAGIVIAINAMAVGWNSVIWLSGNGTPWLTGLLVVANTVVAISMIAH